VLIPVPVGTIVLDENTQERLADLTVNGQRCVIAKGGTGGRGNTQFATSTNRVPTQFEPESPRSSPPFLRHAPRLPTILLRLSLPTWVSSGRPKNTASS
jgi:hypothetical protein